MKWEISRKSSTSERPDPHRVHFLRTSIDESARDVGCLRVRHRLVTLRVQQHLIQTGEHAVCLQRHLPLFLDGFSNRLRACNVSSV
jgi:hypothetical protein